MILFFIFLLICKKKLFNILMKLDCTFCNLYATLAPASLGSCTCDEGFYL